MIKNGNYVISIDGLTTFKIYPVFLNFYKVIIYLKVLSLNNLLPLFKKNKKKRKLELKPPLKKTKKKNNNNRNLNKKFRNK